MKALEQRLRRIESAIKNRRHKQRIFSDGELLQRARAIVARRDAANQPDSPLLSRVREILRRFTGARNV